MGEWRGRRNEKKQHLTWQLHLLVKITNTYKASTLHFKQTVYYVPPGKKQNRPTEPLQLLNISSEDFFFTL